MRKPGRGEKLRIHSYLVNYMADSYDILIEGMINDLSIAVQNGALYLSALGIASYSEYLGGLLTNNLGSNGDNFKAFFLRMNPNYPKMNNDVNLYKRIRCGLVHEYFIKKSANIRSLQKEETTKDGVILHQDGRLEIIIDNLFNEFKNTTKGVKSEIHVELIKPVVISQYSGPFPMSKEGTLLDGYLIDKTGKKIVPHEK